MPKVLTLSAELKKSKPKQIKNTVIDFVQCGKST